MHVTTHTHSRFLDLTTYCGPSRRAFLIAFREVVAFNCQVISFAHRMCLTRVLYFDRSRLANRSQSQKTELSAAIIEQVLHRRLLPTPANDVAVMHDYHVQT